MAGGVSENASMSSVNLARILVDGEQVIVKSSVEFQQELDSKISINDASADQLDEIPGVGPSIASRIIDHREKNGPFSSLQQLTDVSGIGPKMFENIKDLIRL
jgi:competence protein ComEA